MGPDQTIWKTPNPGSLRCTVQTVVASPEANIPAEIAVAFKVIPLLLLPLKPVTNNPADRAVAVMGPGQAILNPGSLRCRNQTVIASLKP